MKLSRLSPSLSGPRPRALLLWPRAFFVCTLPHSLTHTYARLPPESLPDGYGPGARWRCATHSTHMHDRLLRVSRTATAPERGGDAAHTPTLAHLSPPRVLRNWDAGLGSRGRTAHECFRPVAAVILSRSPHEGVTGEARLQLILIRLHLL